MNKVSMTGSTNISATSQQTASSFFQKFTRRRRETASSSSSRDMLEETAPSHGNKPASKATLLFRCPLNIDLSQMAQGLLKGMGDQYFEDIKAASDNPSCQEKVGDEAIRTMAALGIDISNEPLNICKGCDFGRTFDFAISLSDDDFEQCVHVGEDTVTAIWKIPEAEAVNERLADREYLFKRARDRILARLRGLVKLCKQPNWINWPKDEKEAALKALHLGLLAEEFQFYKREGGEIATSKEIIRTTSKRIPTAEELQRQQLELVPGADVVEDVRYFKLNLELKDIPEPSPCFSCGAPMQKEFMEYETRTGSRVIRADTIPGYGCTGCCGKVFDPQVFGQLLDKSAHIASDMGETDLAEHLRKEANTHNEILRRSLGLTG